MKNVISFLVLFAMLLCSSAVEADVLDQLQGKWVINSKTTQKFHVGHSHLPPNYKKLAILNFCVDAGELLGTIQQKLIDAPSKLLVDSFTVVEPEQEFLLLLSPKKSRIESEPIEVDLRLDSLDAVIIKQALISFDGGTNFYTMQKQNSKASPLCRKLIKQKRAG